MSNDDHQELRHLRDSLFGPVRKLEEPDLPETAEQVTRRQQQQADLRQAIGEAHGIPASFVYGDTPEEMNEYAGMLADYRDKEQAKADAKAGLVIDAQGGQGRHKYQEQPNPVRQLLNPDNVRTEAARLPRAE